jgi:hypothetical protein
MNYSDVFKQEQIDELRAVLSDLLIRQGMATPAWEPARAVLGLPPAIPKRGR